MAGFERNRFWNNTYQAIRVINGSDWALNANWMYAEWCTGEKEFYNVSIDPHQIHNTVDELDPMLIKNLSSLVETLGKCAGKSCKNIDLNNLKSGSINSDSLRCFNPPDMPSHNIAEGGDILMNSDLSELSLQPDTCSSVLSDGLPYSDSDFAPPHVLEVWHFCLSTT